MVVPQSQRSHPSSWSSHKDLAAKALKKLAGPHLPGSLRQLETAVKRAHDDCLRAERDAGEPEVAPSAAETEAQPASDTAEGMVTTEADVENRDHADPAGHAAA